MLTIPVIYLLFFYTFAVLSCFVEAVQKHHGCMTLLRIMTGKVIGAIYSNGNYFVRICTYASRLAGASCA